MTTDASRWEASEHGGHVAPSEGATVAPRAGAPAELRGARDRGVGPQGLRPGRAPAVPEPRGPPPGAPPVDVTPAPAPPRRRGVGQLLTELGLYAGTGLVIASLVALAAQTWDDLGEATRITVLLATALVSGSLGLFVASGAGEATPRRRLAGVLLTAAASAFGGTVALVASDWRFVGAAAFGIATLVLVVGQVVAPSAVTEFSLFVATYATGLSLGHTTGPQGPTWMIGPILLGLGWALVVARGLQHPELAVALGMLAATTGALPLAVDEDSRMLGLAVLAGLAAVGLWRYLAEALWPWLAGALAALTSFVFWLVGGSSRPSVAILLAGVALLAASAEAARWSRRRQRRDAGPSENQVPATGAHSRSGG